MSPSRHLVLLTFLTLCSAFGGAGQQEKITLAIKGTAGQFGRYQETAKVEFAPGGEKVTIESKQVTKVSVVKVDADGTLHFEIKTESDETTVNGEAIPSEGPDNNATGSLKANGLLADLVYEGSEPDPDRLDSRLYLAIHPVFDSKPVAVGSQWKYRYSADSKLGTPAAEATLKLVALESVGEAKCAKVSSDYAESKSDHPMRSKAVYWVEIASGDVVQSEYEVQNVPISDGETTEFAKATGNSKRLAGGPLAGTGPAASAEPEPKKIEDVTKGCEKIEGLFTFYRKREAARTSLYLELKEAQLDKLLLLQATAGTGNAKQLVTGTPINDLLFSFRELQKDKLVMVAPNLAYRAKEGTESAISVRRSFADSLLEQFTIEARSKERKALLIDVSDLFRGDISRVSNVFQTAFGLGGSYSIDREKTFVSAVKSFPENSVIETAYNFSGSGAPTLEERLVDVYSVGHGDPRSLTARVVYNLSVLPSDSDYRPRAYDSRIGYFTVFFQDFGALGAQDQQVQWITRWNVQKRDPSSSDSPPKKQIVFWLDNAVPKPYRAAVRDGLLVWNKAFEKIGLKDVVLVEQMPDGADWDPADLRYNVVRWVNSPSESYAVSQPRINPVTGEIVSGSILIDANVVRSAFSEKSGIVDPGHASFNCRVCNVAALTQARAWMGRELATSPLSQNRISSEEYLRQFLVNLVSHEFGHMLGLRHNFAASTELTLVELGDAGSVQTAQPSASVMDYVPFNIQAIDAKDVDYYGLGLGKYDYWAIEYGYSPDVDLKKVASRCNEMGLAYESDEAADGYDPYVTRFDMGADPLAYWDKFGALSRGLVQSLGSRLPATGQSYYQVTKELQTLLTFQAQAATEAVRFIGGIRRNANRKGDPNEKPTLQPVATSIQRKALDQVCKRALSPGAFPIPKAILERLSDNPNANMVQSTLAGQNSQDAMDWIVKIQAAVIDELFDGDRLNRIINNEFKVGRDPFTMAELFKGVAATVWAELGAGGSTSAVRRQLQRKHLETLIDLANQPDRGPEDARMWGWEGLLSLKQLISAAKPQDETTRIHFAHCLSRIDKALATKDAPSSGTGRRSGASSGADGG